MRERIVRRALVVAAALTLAAGAAASADTLWSGDTVGVPGSFDLGAVAPGATIHLDVPFTLACAGTSHVDPDQVVKLTPTILSTMGGGTIAATDTTIGPPPDGWPLDGDGCPAGTGPITSNAPSEVTIVAPLVDGEDYLFQVGYARMFEPPSANDDPAISGSGFTFATFTVDVVSNTAPTLILPSSFTLEGDTTGGATAAYAFGATDAEDHPDPTAACAPAPGDFAPLGTTAVSCSVTDLSGLTTTGGFEITVVDTTAPLLAGLPDGLVLAAADSSGAILAYDLPTATDVVDPEPTVVCVPAPGAVAPVGESTVTCTATDDSGNVAAASFPVHVANATAAWEAPVGGDPAWLVGNYGRTVPVKVALFVDRIALTSGPVDLVVRLCGGGTPLWSEAMSWQPDAARWFGHLETAELPGPGCYTVTAALDGASGPTFRLDLRAAVGTSAPGSAGRG